MANGQGLAVAVAAGIAGVVGFMVWQQSSKAAEPPPGPETVDGLLIHELNVFFTPPSSNQRLTPLRRGHRVRAALTHIILTAPTGSMITAQWKVQNVSSETKSVQMTTYLGTVVDVDMMDQSDTVTLSPGQEHIMQERFFMEAILRLKGLSSGAYVLMTALSSPDSTGVVLKTHIYTVISG